MRKCGIIFGNLGFGMVLSLLCACSVPSAAVSSPLEPTPNTFEDCLRVTHKLLRTFPAQCVTADGKVFVDSRAQGRVGNLCVDHCGNGECEEIVCMELNCPCAETADNCPADCKK